MKSITAPLPPVSPAAFTRRDILRIFGTAGAAFAAQRLAGAALPVLKGAEPGFYRFQIGDFEAIALSDGGLATPISAMSWWADASQKQLADALYAAFEPPEIRLAVTVLLIRTGSELVLIDSGCGGLFGSICGKLPASFKEAGISPAAVTSVILTHGHSDHFGGLLDANGKPAFPNARHFIHGVELDFWSQKNPDLSLVHMPDAAKQSAVANAHQYLDALKGRWTRVKPGEKPLNGIEIVDAAGHTPGQIALRIQGGGEGLLHIADAAHHHTISFEHPDWVFVADVVPGLAIQTRRRLLARAAAERLRLFGAHLPFPSLGHVRNSAGHFEYVIEPWFGA